MECTNENLKDMESSASGDSDKGSCTEAAQIGTTGRDPVEQGASRQEVTDITLGSYGLLESITGWGVSWEPPPLSDHTHILFTLWGSVPALLIRNPRGTNLGFFREGLKDKLERDPR